LIDPHQKVGIFGKTKNYYGMIEVQVRGSLNLLTGRHIAYPFIDLDLWILVLIKNL
jgi:hypothetical protein